MTDKRNTERAPSTSVGRRNLLKTTGTAVAGLGAGSAVASADERARGPTVYTGPDLNGEVYALDPATGERRWSLTVSPGYFTSPTAVDGTLYLGSRGSVHAVDAATGEEEWNTRIGYRDIWSDPTVVDGTVYVGSQNTGLHALDASSGTEQWVFETDAEVPTAPNVADGIVFFGTQDTSVYAVGATSGTKEWVLDGVGTNSSPTVADGTLYVGSGSTSTNVVSALDPTSGAKRWSYEADRAIIASPAVAKGTVYVGSRDSFVYALDGESGDKRWAVETGDMVDAPATVADGIVYVGSRDGVLYAIDAATGSERWSFETGTNGWSAPTVAGETVYVGAQDDHLYAVDATTGTEKWAVETGGTIAAPTVVEAPNDGHSVGSRVRQRILGHHDRQIELVRIKYSPSTILPEQEVTFDGSATDGEVETYTWAFGDGTTATGETATHTYDDPGEYEVTLTVERPDGTDDATTETVDVGEIEIEQTRDRTTVHSPVTVQVQAPVDEGYEYHWRVDETPPGGESSLLHGRTDPEAPQPPNPEEKPHAALTPHAASDDPYVLAVEVVDDDGTTIGTDTVEVQVDPTSVREEYGFDIDGVDTVSDLVEQYAPTYHFHPEENYFPTRYEAYAENADLVELSPVSPEASDADATDALPVPIWDVFEDVADDVGDLVDAAEGELREWIADNFENEVLVEQPSLLEVADAAADDDAGRQVLHLLGDRPDYQDYQDQYPPTIHANVTTTSFVGEGAGTQSRYLAVTYWTFYLFDPKDKGDSSGLDDRLKAFVSSHASDTETVTILFDDTGPQWIAAAQHYSGEFMRWEKVAGTDDGTSIDVYPALGAHSSFLVDTSDYDDAIPGQVRWLSPSQDSPIPLGGLFADLTADDETWQYRRQSDAATADSAVEYDLVRLTGDEPWGEFDGEFTSDHGLPKIEGGVVPQQRGERFEEPGLWIPDRMLPEPTVLEALSVTPTFARFGIDGQLGAPSEFVVEAFENPGVKPHTFVATATITATATGETWERTVRTARRWFDDIGPIRFPLEDIDFPDEGAVEVDARVLTYSPEIASEEDVVFETTKGTSLDVVPFSVGGSGSRAAEETPIEPGEAVERTITATNDGDETDTVLVTLTAVAPGGSRSVDDPGGYETVTLEPGESVETTLSWRPDEDVPEGSYDLSTAVWAEPALDDRTTRLDEQVEQDAVTVEKPTGTIAVSTAPGDARVAVDGSVLDSSTVEWPTGTHEVRAIHGTYGVERTRVTVEEGTTTAVDLDLTPSVSDYADEDGVVRLSGLRDAVDDWQNGEVGTGLLTDLIDAWQSGEPVV